MVQRDVVTGGRAVAVHAGEQDLTCAEGVGLLGPGDGVEARRVTATMGEYFPLARTDVLGVDRDHDALAAELAGGFLDQGGVLDGRSIEGDFVRAGVEHRPDVLDGAEAAADGERHEDLVGRPFDDVDHGASFVAGSGDVEEDELVGALLLVGRGDRDGIAGVAQLFELHALDHAAAVDVETGDDADGEHGRSRGVG